MKKVLALMGIAFVIGMPTAVALAQDYGYYEVNNGDGTCSTISCGPNGCVVVDVHPCPREVSPD